MEQSCKGRWTLEDMLLAVQQPDGLGGREEAVAEPADCEAQRGTDVTLICEVHSLPEFSTLQWDGLGASIPNTTLFLNNTAYIILHSVDQHSQGTYNCTLRQNEKKEIKKSVTLSVTKLSAEPPHGAFRNQSVVLTCEVSEVTDQMTLAWLRMEGNRAVLVKQGVLTNRNSTKTLTLIPRNLSDEQRMWQCAVFTENKLRALAPLSVFAETPQQGGGVVEGTILFVGCAVVGCVVLLLGVLLFYCHRKSAAGAPSKEEKRLREDQCHSDSAYVNRDDGHVVAVKPVEEEEEELHYASITVARVCHGEGRNCRKKAPATSDSTIYSNIKYH
ncbi:uncharacterized protein LOC103037674 isoform X3 [Astyanax mexicanus]|uniref:uncharacterized protein LOC103037674 isoform X3 n=1 Tax=Astyanax mexicanus TaxID=7994 RepID=UPI0020CABFAB|nr:uncharacterized protein LOC103037674 isoform X3 [Astyanax mexicanus]